MNSPLPLWLLSHLSAGALLGGLLLISLLAWRGASAAQRCAVIGVFLLAMAVLTPMQGRWWPQMDVPVLKTAGAGVEPVLFEQPPVLEPTPGLKPQPVLRADAPQSALPTVLMTIWLLGAAVLGVRFAVGAWLWRRLWASARLHELTNEYELRVSERTAVPMAAGKQILMPAEWLEWSPLDQKAALDHELAHLRHGDGWMRGIAALATAMHWPSPFVWMAERRLRLAQEQRCDETVLAGGIDSAAYGRLLMRCAQKARGSSVRWLSPAVACMARPSQLAVRIEHIASGMHPPRPARWWHAVAPLLVVLAGLQALHVRLVAQESAEAQDGLVGIEVKFIDSATPLELKDGMRVGEQQHVLSDSSVLREWLKDDKINVTSYPRMVTKMNCKVVIRSVVHATDLEASLDAIGTPKLDWGGVILDLTPAQTAGKIQFSGELGISTEVGRKVDEAKGSDLPVYEGVRVRIDHAALAEGDTLLVGPVKRPAKKGEATPPELWLLIKAWKTDEEAELADAISKQRQKAPKPVHYDFTDVDVTDILRFLSGDVLFDRLILGEMGTPQRIGFDIKKPPLDALLYVCDKAGLKLTRSGRYWVVARPGAAMPMMVPGEAAQKLREQAEQRYDFSKAAAGDVLRFLMNDTGAEFYSLPDDTPESRQLLTFSVNDSPFGVVEAICGTLRLSLMEKSGVWYVRREKETQAAEQKKPKSADAKSEPVHGLDQVRAVLRKLPFVGEKQDANGKVIKIMLGDMLLQPGMIVPPVFANQTGILKVKAVTKEHVMFIWTEPGKEDVLFKMTTPYKQLLKARDSFEGKQF